MALVTDAEPPLCGALILRGRAERRACSSSSDVFLRSGRCSTPDLHAQSTSDGLATARDRFTSAIAAESTFSSLVPPTEVGPSREASIAGTGDDRLRRTCAWYQTRAESAEAELQALREGMKQLRNSTADLQLQVQLAHAKAAERETHAEAAEGRAFHWKLQLDDARSEAGRLEARVEAAHAEAAAQKLWTEAAKAEAATQYLRAATAEEETLAYRSWVEAAKVMQASVAQANAEGEHLLQASSQQKRGAAASPTRVPPGASASRITEPEAEARSQQWDVDYEDLLLRRSDNFAGSRAEAAGNSSPLRASRAQGIAAGAPVGACACRCGAAAGSGQLPPAMPPRQPPSSVEALHAARVADLEAQLAHRERVLQEAVDEANLQSRQAVRTAEERCSELQVQLTHERGAAAAEVKNAATRISDLSSQLSEQAQVAELAKAQSERSSGLVWQLEAQLAQAEHVAQRTSELEALLARPQHSDDEASQLESRLSHAERRVALRGEELEAALKRAEAGEGRNADLETELGSMRMAMVEAMRQTDAEGTSRLKAAAQAHAVSLQVIEDRERDLMSRLSTQEAVTTASDQQLSLAQAELARARVVATQASDRAERAEAELQELRRRGEAELQDARKEGEAASLEARSVAARAAELEALHRSRETREAELQAKLEAAASERKAALARAAELEVEAGRLRAQQEGAAKERAEVEAARGYAERRVAELEAKLEAMLSKETQAIDVKKDLEVAKKDMELQVEKQLAASKIALGKAQAEGEQLRQALDTKTREFQSQLEQQRGTTHARICELQEQLEEQRAAGERALAAAREDGEKQLRACEVRNRELSRQLAAVQDALTAESKATIKMSELATELAQQRREAELQLASEAKHHTLRPSESRQTLRARDLEGKCSARTLQPKRHANAASMPSIPAVPSGPSRRQERPSSAGGEALAAASRSARPRSAGPHASEAPQQLTLVEGSRSGSPKALSCSRSFSAGSLHQPTLHGVSVHHLKTMLLDEVYAAGLNRGATLYEVETGVLRALGANSRCTKDGRLGASYVDLIRGEDASGPATHLLSCSKGSTVGDMADALDQYCREAGLSPKRTYVWHSALCVNPRQRRTARCRHGGRGRSGCAACGGEREDTFVEDLTCRIRSIGKVLAIVSPWEKPEYLSNAGCITEMFLALSLGSVEVSILTPPVDGERLAADLLDGGPSLTRAWQALSSVRIEECKASDSQEAEAILRFVQDGPGVANVDASVARRLQTWLAEEAERHARRLLAAGDFDGYPAARVCDAVGWMLREVSLSDRATSMLQDGLQLSLRAGALGSDVPPRSTLLSSIGAAGLLSGGGPDAGALRASEDAARLNHERTGTLETPAGLALLSSIGSTKWLAGDSVGALEALLEAKRVRHDMGTLETLDGAVLLRNIGTVRWARGDHDGGLQAYAEARALYEKTGSLATCGGVGLLLNIGFAKADRDDVEGSLEAYEEAKRIFEAHGTLEMPSGATLLSSIGVARGNMGDQAGALAAYQQARCIRERTGTIGSLAGAILLRNTGIAHAASGDRTSALEVYDEAWQLRAELGAQETPAGAGLLSNMGQVKAEQGDHRGELEACREAKRIYECSGSLRSKGGRALSQHLEELEAVEELSPCWV